MRKLIIIIFVILPFLVIAQENNKSNAIGVTDSLDVLIKPIEFIGSIDSIEPIVEVQVIDSIPAEIVEEIAVEKVDSVFVLINKKKATKKKKGFFPTLFKMERVKLNEPDSLLILNGEKNGIAGVKMATSVFNKDKNNVDKWGEGRSWGIGIQLGTDIGGAIPVPFKYIPTTFNPYPKLNVSIGARGSWSFNDRWSFHAETTYKRVYMGADARVLDQKSTIGAVIAYFSGTAYMEMDFTMVEIPIYAKMALSKKYNDFLIVGGYYSYILNAKFITTPLIGYTGNNPGHVGVVITPDSGDPIPMDFSDALGSHDAGIVIGYERRIWGRANIGLRLMVGCVDIFKSDMKILEYKMLHMRGVVNLEYDLFLLK